MTADAVINKIVITDEARFDYESLFGLPIPRADMKGECEKYIDNISGQNIGYYMVLVLPLYWDIYSLQY